MNAKNLLFLCIIANIQLFSCNMVRIIQQIKKTNDNATYNVIKTLLDKYQRPFTLFAISANEGRYSLQVANDYKNSVFVILEEKIAKLLNICNHKNLDNVILLHKKVNIQDLQRISECEHFDVILLCNIYNRFGNTWKGVLDKACNMGDNIVVEEQKNNGEVIAYLKTREAKLVGTTTTSNIYLIEAYKKTIERVNWIFKKVRQKNSHIVHSDFQEKNLIKKTEGKIRISSWIPGINLMTFKMFHGVYPQNETAKRAIKNLEGRGHTDFVPNNIIIQGKKAALIDFDDKRPEYLRYSEKIVQAVLKFVDTPAYDIRKYYVTMFLFKGYQTHF